MVRPVSLLKFMYNMERFATQIYRTQRKAFTDADIVGKLVAAAENEQQHADDLHKRVLALGGTPSRLGFLFRLAGKLTGLLTRGLGKRSIPKADIWVERRAIRDYRSFLNRARFDDESVALIERIISDEKWHVDTWEGLAKTLKSKKEA